MSGKQIKLFLVEGTPGGMTTAEIANWTGHVLVGVRSDLAALLRRNEASRTGVYLLLGEDFATAEPKCYIGEADLIADRLRSHARQKDFWDRVVIVTSKDSNLTKAHCRYLESRLITLASEAGRVQLENGTAPPKPPLPEADVSDMDYFIDQLHIVLPVVGVNAIRIRPKVRQSRIESSEVGNLDVSPVFHLTVARRGISARAQQIDGEFTVLAGATIANSVRESAEFTERTAAHYGRYRALHERFVRDGSIVLDGKKARVVRDIVFTSPSRAGSVITGRACNGRKQWVTEEGISFGEWEERGMESEPQ